MTLTKPDITTSLTGKWKSYPAYKDSGVEWLGEIPVHWEVRRLKYATGINQEVLPESTDPDYMLKYVDISNVDSYGAILDAQEMSFENAPSRARRLVRHGDTIISTVRTYLRAIGLIAHPPENLIVSTGFAVLRPISEMNAKFLWRLVQSDEFVNTVVAYSEGVGYPAINPGRLGNLFTWLPPLPEQCAIATFLDRETAKINALIAKKERLVELLQEKRAALISQAVTKGLDPTVPMKDSGIEWLGEIPAHWQVKRIAMAAQKITNGYVGPTRDILVDEGVRYLQSLHIKNGEIKFNRPYYVTEEWSKIHDKSILCEGDVLIVQTGDIGQCCAVPKEFVGCNCHALIITQLKDELGSGFYLSAFLRSDYGRNMLLYFQTPTRCATRL